MSAENPDYTSADAGADTPAESPGEQVDREETAGPPEHVVAAFYSHTGRAPHPVPAGRAWDYGWKVGNIVFSPVEGHQAAWSARVREAIRPEGVRCARPLRSADGRVMVAGWRASSFEPGRPEERVDETVAAALRLDDALRSITEFPDLSASDVFARADRAAWAITPGGNLLPDSEPLDDGLSVDMLRRIQERLEIPGEEFENLQVTHTAMLDTTIYHDLRTPVVTDIVGAVRPYGYTAALTIVDALIAQACHADIINRFNHIPDLYELVLRGFAYRIYVHELLENPSSQGISRMFEALETVCPTSVQ